MSFLKFIGPAIAFTLIACNLNLPAPTLESERDLTGKYDGKWSLETNTKIGNCKNNFKRAYMNVSNGEGKIGSEGPSGTGFISTAGNFYIEVPYNYNGTRRKYGGNLVNSEGRVLIEFSSSAATDCSIGLSIKRVK